MGMFYVCRAEDFHLWFEAAKDVYFAMGVMLVFLAMGIGCLRYYKKMSDDLIGTIKCSGYTEIRVGDNWPSLQMDMFNFDSSDEFTYADFERSCMQTELKQKELCKQK